MPDTEFTSIPVRPETRDMVKSQKRGGMSYDALVRKMCSQYNPEIDS